MASINAYYFRVCSAGAERRGLAPQPLLARAGISEAQRQNPLWRGSVASMAALVRSIWDDLDDEFMGYTARPVRRGAFALMAELAHNADSVWQGLQKATRFYNLLDAGIQTHLHLQQDQLFLTVEFAEPGRDPEHYFTEFWLIIWHRLACWLAAETLPLLRADFTYPRPDSYLEEFKYLFPCPHRFDQPRCQLLLDKHSLRGPVRRSRDELQQMVGQAPLDLMTIPASANSPVRQVRRCLHARLDQPQGLHTTPTLDSIAAELHIAPDTLRRRLRREGTSLSRLVEDMRRDHAIRLLLDGNRTVEQIAATCGYLEARSFTRAFRQWTGYSPSAYRRGFSR